MNKQLIESALDNLKSEMGNALNYFSLVSTSTGQSVIGYNNNPQKDAYVIQAIAGVSKSVQIGDFTLVDNSDGTAMMTVHFQDYVVLVEVVKEKMLLGMFLNVVLPEIKADFSKAIG